MRTGRPKQSLELPVQERRDPTGVAASRSLPLKHAKVKAWLARRPRFHLHYTPTYSSWLNQVERWFGLITQRAIRRGSFTSVSDLRRQIEHFVADWNQHPQPFMWTATADSSLPNSND